MNSSLLKQKLTEHFIQDSDTRTRIHRGISWLKASELLNENEDGKFIFLWTGFNACYAALLDDIYHDEKGRMHQYLDKLISLDSEEVLLQCIWGNLLEESTMIIQNMYLCREFWLEVHGNFDNWEEYFNRSIAQAQQYYEEKNLLNYLKIVLERIYTLRNQIVHGGSTYGSTINRQQLKSCLLIMSELLPITITIMIENPHEDWGILMYPPLQ